MKNKLKDAEKAKMVVEKNIQALYSIILAYLTRTDKVDILEEPFNHELTDRLNAILNAYITINDDHYDLFCVDDVMPRYISSEDGVFKYWGFVYWLSTPNDYYVNKSGKDPFYCAFKVEGLKIELLQMSCGDYNLIDIDKHRQLQEVDFDWVFNFINEEI